MPVSMTRLEINWDDSRSRSKLDINAVQAVAAVWLADKNASRHAVMDIETVVDEPFSFAFNGLDTLTVIGLFDEIARQFPAVRFYVRGIGEEFSNMWLREYFNGEAVFSAGPFERQVSEHLSNKGKSWFSRWLGR
ncbi:Uncharacterised protein [Kingella potus]|uniref:Uncharacterized protein n=1 Tax=Kingella potus TaxID=265175 RepID=A0A377QY92_9NEIS|nr:hypothetical protein [Kingella potus]UOP01476.1 hypothetical protein LVJ84_04595 [Kingella potus]STR00203.1 Uncharacterised protein [Kingella potus]